MRRCQGQFLVGSFYNINAETLHPVTRSARIVVLSSATIENLRANHRYFDVTVQYRSVGTVQYLYYSIVSF